MKKDTGLHKKLNQQAKQPIRLHEEVIGCLCMSADMRIIVP